MKKLTLLIAAIFISAVCFAQRVSMADFCYKDLRYDSVETFSDQEIIEHLAIKGFAVIKTEYYYGEGEGGATCRFKEVTLYQRSTNTTVIIDNGPNAIIFNSVNDARSFIAEATNMQYISYYDSNNYVVNGPLAFGVDGLWQKGNTIEFSISVP
jgi:hypothetical protein